jgi:hypothetical protein
LSSFSGIDPEKSNLNPNGLSCVGGLICII